MNLSVQRFKKGHPLYSEAILRYEGKDYKSVFGEMIDSDTGKFICYTMERLDTLIPDGMYNITYHNSPSNKCICPHLYSDAVGKERYILIHPANYAYQLKGCTAVGTGINLKTTMITSSKPAFNRLMTLLNNNPSKINYKTF